MNLHFWWSVEPFLREKMLHLHVNYCKMWQNQNVFHLWAGEIFVLIFILCVYFLLYMLKGARAFQFSSPVEVISAEKCRLYEASAAPDSLLLDLCRKLCVWLWHLIKVHGWWWGKRSGGEKPCKGKKCKKKKWIFLISVCLDYSFSEWMRVSKMSESWWFCIQKGGGFSKLQGVLL